MLELIEKNIRDCSPKRIEELVKIFIHGTRVSYFAARFSTLYFELLLMCFGVDGDWLLGNVSREIDALTRAYKGQKVSGIKLSPVFAI